MVKETLELLREVVADKDNTISNLDRDLRLARTERNNFSMESDKRKNEKYLVESDLKNKTSEFERLRAEFFSIKKVVAGTAEARSKIDVLKDLLTESRDSYHNNYPNPGF